VKMLAWIPLVSLLLIGCKPGPTTNPTLQSANKEVAEAGDKLNTAKNAYLASLRDEMRDADIDLDKLRARARNATGDAKVKLETNIKGLESHRGTVQRQLDDVASDSKRGWDELKIGMDKSWAEFKTAVKKANDEFK